MGKNTLSSLIALVEICVVLSACTTTQIPPTLVPTATVVQTATPLPPTATSGPAATPVPPNGHIHADGDAAPAHCHAHVDIQAERDISPTTGLELVVEGVDPYTEGDCIRLAACYVHDECIQRR